MNGLLQPPTVTAFDAAASIVSLLVYLAVALAAFAKAPRDARARTFLGFAAASAVPYALSPLQWWKGDAAYTPVVIALTSTAFAVGGVALFHFTQVFPAQRPFAARHFGWIAAAYLALPPPVAVVAWAAGWIATSSLAYTAGGGPAAESVGVSVGVLLLAIPLLLVVGVLLPFAGVLSLVKSWREARDGGRERDRSATAWILISQLGGGVLSVLVLPMLHLVSIGMPWSMIIAALAYAFALLLPLAFARYMFST